jgi:putative ABC transport system permease protein
MLRDNFILAYKNIRERMSRSILTLLGIAIGVMAIISLMALGEGMNQAVSGELSSLSDTIIVQVGEGFSIFSMGGDSSVNGGEEEYLTERDIADVKRISGIKEVSTQLSGIGIMSYNGEDVGVSLTGMVVEAMDIRYGAEDLESGHLLQNGDQNKIIIGYDVANTYFDADISVGSRIKINGEKFFVTGIFSMVGSGGLTSTDDIILLTSRDFEKLTGEGNIQSATVTVIDVNNVELIADEIEQAINGNHGDDDFASATSMSSILESIQNVIGIMQIMLVAIASIALVVASIGIMNTMLTSVMERTREIGIMKAIGAANIDVMLIFIIEGMLVSFVGGVFGILLGVFGSQGLTRILSSGPMASGGGGMALTPIISISSIGLAVGVSLIVGILSSLYPAWKAAKMSPIEAVRYE